MSKVSREIKVLMLVTLHPEPNFEAVEYSDWVDGPALRERDDDSPIPRVSAWNPEEIFGDLALVLQAEFAKDKGNSYYIKSVKQAIAE